MTRRQWRLSGLIIGLACALSASLVLATSRGGATVPAATEHCELTVAGRGVSRADRPSRALRLRSGGAVIVAGVDAQTTTSASVEATLSPDMPDRLVWHIRQRHFEPPTSAYEIPIDMNDVASYGVGVNVITVRTDHCASTVWVRVGGRPPVFTALGIAGFTLGVSGAIAVIVNLWRSGAAGSATFPGAIGGGVPLGVGTALLVQQMGLIPITRATAIAWVVFMSAGASGLHLLRRMDSIRRATEANEANLEWSTDGIR